LTNLINNIQSQTAKIGIVGMGYVGIPIALLYAKVGYLVTGFDIDKNRVDTLNSGKSPISNFPDDDIARAIKNGLCVTENMKLISDMDVIIICVPTPLTKQRDPDLTFVINTVEVISQHASKGTAVSLESTTWPGTTHEVIRPIFEKKGFVIGQDLYLIYSSEREDPGNRNFSLHDVPKIISGETSACLELAHVIYRQIVPNTVALSSTQAAEMTKLLENIQRSVNIGLMNEMKIICSRMNLDIFEIVDAAKTKPFGFAAYYPGPGVGGQCIPIDPFYLTWKAKEHGLHTRFIELSGEVNASMPAYVVEAIIRALNGNGLAIKNSSILLLGLSYKANINDVRHSPSIEIIKILYEYGAKMEYSDPFWPEFPPIRDQTIRLKAVNLTPELINNYDVVVLLTDHKDYDYKLLTEHAKLIVDTRGKFDFNASNVVRA
jgi:UDP-N-acetyl-D-glucosamine dehydrogenase